LGLPEGLGKGFWGLLDVFLGFVPTLSFFWGAFPVFKGYVPA